MILGERLGNEHFFYKKNFISIINTILRITILAALSLMKKGLPSEYFLRFVTDGVAKY